MHNPKKAPSGNRKKTLRRQFDALLEQVQTTRIHFRNVVEKNVDGIVLLGEDHHILYLNPAAEQLFGEARKDLIGQVWTYEVPQEDPLETVLHHRVPERSVEMRGVPTEWEGAPAILISIRDISERIQAEQAIRQLNLELENKVARRTVQLEALNRELEAFNYAVSHDLRTPLARIDGYASLLMTEMADRLDGDNAHFLQRIRASVTQMVELTDGLLQLSRLTQRPLEPSEFSLSTLASGILDALHQDEPRRQVEFSVQPDMTVFADYVLLRAVMENLLSNAWKFTAKTDVTRIAVGCTEEKKETVYMVRDNGIGFNMDESARLFQAFQRLHSDAQFPGTGVGLTTVRRIIHRHQGSIRAESAPSQGATFFFTLPVHGTESLSPFS
jgi:signal transduction histidine kinase